VTRYGFSEKIGLINYEEDDDNVFLGYEMGKRRHVSETLSGEIDKEVKGIVDSCYARARSIIEENMDVLHDCAKLLIEKEKISREEFEALFKNKVTEVDLDEESKIGEFF